MVRRALKSQLACVCHWSGADRLLAAWNGTKDTPLVLGYHRVVEDFASQSRRTIPAMLVSCRMLERQLDWLGQHYRFVSLDDLGALLESGAPAGTMAAVTFDDGYRDFYENAFPLLKRKGIPAALFVVTDLLGTSRLQLHDKLYLLLSRAFERARGRSAVLAFLGQHGPRGRVAQRLTDGAADASATLTLLLDCLSQAEIRSLVDRLESGGPLCGDALAGLEPLSWEMLTEMQRGGLTVGSHTATHAILRNEDRAKQMEETTASRELLERRLGVAVRHFAYPGGLFDAQAVDSVSASGYGFAYTACRHRDARHPLLTIPRVLLWERSAVDAGGRFSPAVMGCHAQRLLPISSRCGGHGVRSWRAEQAS